MRVSRRCKHIFSFIGHGRDGLTRTDKPPRYKKDAQFASPATVCSKCRTLGEKGANRNSAFFISFLTLATLDDVSARAESNSWFVRGWWSAPVRALYCIQCARRGIAESVSHYASTIGSV